MKQPVLLCYNLQGERFRKIRLAAMRYKIRLRVVKPEEYDQPLLKLCQEAAPEGTSPVNAAFTDEMLVMGYFSGMLVHQFLQAFRQQGLSPVALKAVLTPTNCEWTSVQLHGEISQEHEALSKGETSIHESEQS